MSVEAEVQKTLGKIGADVNAFIAAQKERTERLGEKQTELQAMVMDLAQRADRNRDGGGDYFEPHGSLRSAIEASSSQIAAVADGRSRLATIDMPKGFFAPKAALLSGGGIPLPDRRDGIIDPVVRRLRIRDLIPSVQVNAGALQYVRETGFTNNAATVSEGDTKPESSLSFSLVTAPVVTIAHWLKASKAILDDWAVLMAYIDRRLRYGLEFAIENQILKGSGVGNNLNGIYTQASAYTGGGGTKLDTIRKAIVQLENLEYSPNAILLNPQDFAEIELAKATDGTYVLGSPGRSAEPRLWGRQVIISSSMTNETFAVADLSQIGVVLDRESTRVDISGENQDDFIKNMITVRCEARIGLAVWRPGAMVKGSFGS